MSHTNLVDSGFNILSAVTRSGFDEKVPDPEGKNLPDSDTHTLKKNRSLSSVSEYIPTFNSA